MGTSLGSSHHHENRPSPWQRDIVSLHQTRFVEACHTGYDMKQVISGHEMKYTTCHRE